MTPGDALRAWLRRAYHRALPVSVRDMVSLQRELASRESLARAIDVPSGRRIVALAPHEDDEAFGCGGTLALAAAAGCDVRVVFLTDGAKGYDRRHLDEPGAPPAEEFERRLVRTRQAEAAAASAALGLAPPRFLGLPDGGLAADPAAVDALAGALRELAPELVFLPHFGDPHPDHHATAKHFLAAAAAAGLSPSLPCWGYEVWSPVVANAYVDIGQAMPRKQAAMRAHASQIGTIDYPRAIAGLNAYRSLGAGQPGGYAEAFHVETLAEWRRLYGAVWGGA